MHQNPTKPSYLQVMVFRASTCLGGYSFGARQLSRRIDLDPAKARQVASQLKMPGTRLVPTPSQNLALMRPLVSRYSTAIDRKSSEKMLLRLIDSEIHSALQLHDRDLDDEPTPGINPYTIEDDGGKTVTLTRDYQGEHIRVVAGMPYEDGQGDGLCFPLNVNFTKKSGLSLKFRCTSFPGNGTSMDGVSVINRGDSWEDQRASDLLSDSKNLDYRFSYLAMIFDYSPRFSLHKYMTTGTRKYVLWLKALKKFLKE